LAAQNERLSENSESSLSFEIGTMEVKTYLGKETKLIDSF